MAGRPPQGEKPMLDPVNVRFDGPLLARIDEVKGELHGARAVAVRHLVELGLRWRASERPASPPGVAESGPSQAVSARFTGAAKVLDGVGVPLVAIDVAAGDGALTPIEDLDDGAVYFFHEAWMRKAHGWNEKQRDRFACIKLGSDRTAASMEPMIRPKSLLLLDRRVTEERLKSKPREIYLVRPPGEKEAVKFVTLDGGVLILESDNPAPAYPPRAVSLKGEALADIVRARVLWWATEA